MGQTEACRAGAIAIEHSKTIIEWIIYTESQLCYNGLMQTVQMTIELPQGIFSALRQEPDVFLREMRLAAAVKWYELEQVSQAKAAEIAGISRADFLDALGRFNVTPFQLTVDELIAEAGANIE